MSLDKWWILAETWQDLCDLAVCCVVGFICWAFDKLDPWHSEDKGLWRDTDSYNMTSPKEAKEAYLEWKEANK